MQGTNRYQDRRNWRNIDADGRAERRMENSGREETFKTNYV